MAFLSPWFLAGALAVALPVALHLFRREADVRIEFPAFRLLAASAVEHRARRRLRDWWLLALRVAAVLLVALAFARPFRVSSAAGPARFVTVVALDTSLSMSAPGVFEQARRLARSAVRDVPPGERVGVVTFADAPRIAAAPSLDRALAASAVTAAAPGFGGTRYRGAFDAALQMIGGDAGRVIVVTDLQESGWEAGERVAIPEAVTVQVLATDPAPPNLAVVAARLADDRVVATIRNTGRRAREARVSLTVDGRRVSEAVASVLPHEAAEVALRAASGTSGAVTVEDDAGLAGDNTRYLVIGPDAASALVVTTSGDLGRDGFYVQQALTAGRAAGSRVAVEGVSGRALGQWDAGRLARYPAVFLLSTQGLESQGRQLLAQYVRAGGGVVLALGPDVDGEVALEALGRPPSLVLTAPVDGRPARTRAFAPVDLRHPIVEAFGARLGAWGLVRFSRLAGVSHSACPALARFDTGESALVDCEVGLGRVLVLASDLGNRWNDFARHAVFVPFLRESLRYVAGAPARPRDRLVGDAPAGAPREPGIVTGADGVTAINVDPRESAEARLSDAAFRAALRPQPADARVAPTNDVGALEDRQHLWQYLLIAVIGVLVAESLVARRAA